MSNKSILGIIAVILLGIFIVLAMDTAENDPSDEFAEGVEEVGESVEEVGDKIEDRAN